MIVERKAIYILVKKFSTVQFKVGLGKWCIGEPIHDEIHSNSYSLPYSHVF
jgi:hypothetical protein